MASSYLTDTSRQSLSSQALHKSAYQLNQNKLFRLIDDIDDETMHKIWAGLGLHVSRQMRMGRGVLINKFGQFTFGPIDFNKDGLACQKLREKQQRMPVFLVSPEFIKGGGLKQSIYSELTQQLRAYTLVTSGQIQQVSVNYSEIGNIIQIHPTKCKAGINRMIQTLAHKIQQSGQADLEIPGIGYIVVRNSMCAVNFYQSFIHSTQNSVNLPLDERKEKGDMTLTAANLNVLEYRNNYASISPEKTLKNQSNIEVASSADLHLQNSLGINLASIIAKQKKTFYDGENVSLVIPRNGEMGERSVSQRSISRSHIIRDLSSGKKTVPKTAASQRSYKTTSISSEMNNSNYPQSQRIILYWMRQNHLDSERAFIQFCEQGLGKVKSYQLLRLSFDQFKQCVEKNQINLTFELIENAFRLLDERGNGYVDYIDWQRLFGEYLPSQIKHLDQIRDIIFKKGLRTDDILKTMKLSRDSSPLSRELLSQAIKLIDMSLNDTKAERIADVILQINGSSTIRVQQLTKLLQSLEEDDKEHDPTWYKNLLWRLKFKFSNQKLLEDLKEKFTNYDEHNEGFLDIASFKICLLKSQLKLSISEINRMLRYTSKDKKERIDYFNFLEQISNIESTRVAKERIFDRNDFLQKLKIYFREFPSTQDFLKEVNTNVRISEDISTNSKVTLAKFAQYLRNNLFQDETVDFIELFIKQIDFSKDGLIDIYDLQQFINNGRYIDQIAALSDSMKMNPIQTIKYLPANQYDSRKIENLTDINLNAASSQNITYKFTTNSASKKSEIKDEFIQQDPLPFPVNPLSEDKVNLILRDLRKNVESKKLTFRQLFDLLDEDKNGMISSHEFMTNIDNFISLSQPIKDGFFAYIDKFHIGMIDLNNFLLVLEKSVNKNSADQVTDDNWTWQNLMIKKLYEWYLKGHFPSEEEAFRVLDFEYKGFIEHDDLKKFLRDVLKIKEQELTTARINRLFKIIDYYKSGRIGIIDFIKFIQQQRELQNIIQFQNSQNNIEKDSQYLRRSQSTNNSKSVRSISNKKSQQSQQVEVLNVDWKKSVQQQLGLKISQQFSTIQSSFESVSEYKSKITFEKFTNWIESTHSLSGFDLTQTLLQQLFAYFDPHKKGFLTESDWISAFGHIDWKKQMIEELRNLVNLHFSKNSQIKSAFDFFVSRNDNSNLQNDQKVINLEGYFKGIDYLYPGRFTRNDITKVWDSEINPLKKPGMDFNMFLGFLKKTIQSGISLSSRKVKNNLNSSVVSSSSQNTISRQTDLSDNKDEMKFRSYTPITVTGQKVAQSPQNRNSNQDVKIKYIQQSGSKYSSPTKSSILLRKRENNEITDFNSGKIQSYQLLSSNNKAERSSANERYDLIQKNNLAGTSFGLNQSSGIQTMSSVYPKENSNYLIQQGEQIIQKIKRVLRSSFTVNLQETLQKQDESQTGILTNLQFKKVLNELNLGLKNTEIFFLINLCGVDGRLEIKKFLKLLEKSEDDNMIVERGKAKLKQVSSKIYSYLISPIDAFRQFNTKRDGNMNLQEFEAVIKQLNILSGEPQEGLQVIKDMFRFLDRNQDGYISLNEWNDVLSSVQTSFSHLGRIPNERDQLESEFAQKKFRSMSSNNMREKNTSFMKIQDILQQSMSEKKQEKKQLERNSSTERSAIFRISNKIQEISGHERSESSLKKKARFEIKDHDHIMNILARNRKYMMDLFLSYNQANIAITYELAKQIIMKVLNSQGIQVLDTQIHQFIQFAERDGIVDYKMLLDVYKDRLISTNSQIKV